MFIITNLLKVVEHERGPRRGYARGLGTDRRRMEIDRMLDIIAGEDEGSYDLAVGGGLPGHVSVVAARDLDVEVYGEAELTDSELLGLAAEDAVEAQQAGRLAGPALDETALRRTRRRAERQVLGGVLRTEGVMAA